MWLFPSKNISEGTISVENRRQRRHSRGSSLDCRAVPVGTAPIDNSLRFQNEARKKLRNIPNGIGNIESTFILQKKSNMIYWVIARTNNTEIELCINVYLQNNQINVGFLYFTDRSTDWLQGKILIIKTEQSGECI